MGNPIKPLQHIPIKDYPLATPIPVGPIQNILAKIKSLAQHYGIGQGEQANPEGYVIQHELPHYVAGAGADPGGDIDLSAGLPDYYSDENAPQRMSDMRVQRSRLTNRQRAHSEAEPFLRRAEARYTPEFERAYNFVREQEQAGPRKNLPGANIGFDRVARQDFLDHHPEITRDNKMLAMYLGMGFDSYGSNDRPMTLEQEAQMYNNRMPTWIGDHSPYQERIGKMMFYDIWRRHVLPNSTTPQMRLAHFDAAVNQGPGAALRMVQESRQNVEDFIDRRIERYKTTKGSEGDIRTNPGWFRRRIPMLREAIRRMGNE